MLLYLASDGGCNILTAVWDEGLEIELTYTRFSAASSQGG
jgi:hypothetical protein